VIDLRAEAVTLVAAGSSNPAVTSLAKRTDPLYMGRPTAPLSCLIRGLVKRCIFTQMQ